MTIPHGQRAWQDNPEPPDHDEPTLRDRLEAMPHEDLLTLIMEWADENRDFWKYLETDVWEWEQEQLAKVATP